MIGYITWIITTTMIDYNELMAWDKNDLAEYILTLLEESEQTS